MNQWDVWTFEFGAAGPHPAVIISHPDRIARAPLVNVLLCTSMRAIRPPRAVEVILDQADGLDWETLVRCDLIYLVEKRLLFGRRGRVSVDRRRSIVRKTIQCLGFDAS